MGKLNVDLYNRSVSIEHRNGFELYRLIVKAIDEIPENAKFLKGAELSKMVETVQEQGGRLEEFIWIPAVAQEASSRI